MASGDVTKDNEPVDINGMEGASLERLLHELRTPLSVVKGSTRTVLRHWDGLDDDRRRVLLARALEAVDELARAITDFHNGATRAPSPTGAGEQRARSLPERSKLSHVVTERAGPRFAVKVSIHHGDSALAGEHSAFGGKPAQDRAVVHATLDALRDVFDGGAELEDVDVVQSGDERVAVVAVTRGTQALLGSAVVTSDDYDAICRATLDALNRVVATPAR